MVVGARAPARVGRCQAIEKLLSHWTREFLLYEKRQIRSLTVVLRANL